MRSFFVIIKEVGDVKKYDEGCHNVIFEILEALYRFWWC